MVGILRSSLERKEVLEGLGLEKGLEGLSGEILPSQRPCRRAEVTQFGKDRALRQPQAEDCCFSFWYAMLCGSKWKEGSDPRVLHMILRISGLNMPRDK